MIVNYNDPNSKLGTHSKNGNSENGPICFDK